MKTILLKLAVLGLMLTLSWQSNAQNLLTDGSFSSTTVITPLGAPPVPLNTWCSWKDEATVTTFSATVTDGVCHYNFYNSTANSNNAWQVQLSQYGFPIKPAYRYKLSFDVMADAARDFGVYLGEEGGSWTNILGWSNYWQSAGTTWKTVVLEFVAGASFPLHKLSFESGNNNTPIHFDNIILEELGPVTTTVVIVPGNFQSELGCSGDWQPDCAKSELTYKPGTIYWEGTFNIPAGNYEFKIALNKTWDINYGAGGVQNGANIILNLPFQSDVTFIYDSVTHIVTTSYVNQVYAVNIPGSFQSELGCYFDWDPTCIYTGLTHDETVSGDWLGLFYIPQGNYEFKIAINNSWNENYGENGILNGPNMKLNLSKYSKVAFRYNPVTHITTTSVVNDAITLAGSFQSELGCTGDWMPDCSFGALVYNYQLNVWEGTYILPTGNYEFKVAVDNSWNENYGTGGIPNGPNYQLPVSTVSRVSFIYYPISHVVAYVVEPITVVLPGTFQSELGCIENQVPAGGDWEPGCDFTRLTYDPLQKIFVGTFPVGKGHWEYKVAHNNSWYENYGLYGIRNGDNIPLDLPFDCVITFKYDPVTHLVFLDYKTSGVCVNKFYDANVNGFQDYGEPSMEGINFTVTGKEYSATGTTGSDGKVCFSGLNAGVYSVEETIPVNYYTTNFDSQVVNLGEPVTLNFGNVCLGAGGAYGTGFWMNKNGQAQMTTMGMDNVLWWLRYMHLRNADGSDFDPYTYAEFRNWMQNANAKNMAYKLSAAMATMFLNLQAGYVDYSDIIYTPGCGFMGAHNNFIYAGWLVWNANYYLMFMNDASGNDPNRLFLECYKNALDNANNNLTFVQSQPCNTAVAVEKRPAEDISMQLPQNTARIWPNPSSDHFTLRPSVIASSETVTIRVMDINGKQVYAATGVANKDYQFGQQFKAGLYFVEVIQGEKRNMMKIVKQ